MHERRPSTAKPSTRCAAAAASDSAHWLWRVAWCAMGPMPMPGPVATRDGYGRRRSAVFVG